MCNGMPSAPPFPCFNPRARMGRDAKATGGNEPAFLFQSTRLREARHLRPEDRGHPSQCFNPRACVRRDIYGQKIAAILANVSIHAPA